MATLDAMSTLTSILEDWEKEKVQARPDELVSILTRLANLVEDETEAYYKMDPDPFEYRHPGRANPTFSLGHLLKTLIKNEEFMNKLTDDYLMRSRAESDLNVVASRLLLDISPLLDFSYAFFQSGTDFPVVKKLFVWSETATEPLRSYSTGVLAGAMEVQDIATTFRDSSAVLIPILLRRLHELKKAAEEEREKARAEDTRHFSMFSRSPRSSRHNNADHSKDGSKDVPVLDDSVSTGDNDKRLKVSDVPIESTAVRPGPAGDNEKTLKVSEVPNDSTSVRPGPAGDNEKTLKVSEVPIESTPVRPGPAGDNEKTLKVSEVPNDSTSVRPSPVGDNEKTLKVSEVPIDSTSVRPSPVGDNEKTLKVSDVPIDSKPVRPGPAGDNKKTFKVSDVPIDSTPVRPGPAGDNKKMLKRSLSTDVCASFPKRARNESITFECSNSSWKELEPYVIGSSCMSPIDLSMKQRLILQYLTPMAEYNELCSTVFENNAMDLITYYIDLEQNRDVRLAFDALRYLATLLCHKKFALEFISIGGVEKLMRVYRPSIAATGVSLCIYYLSYFEFAMEKVCLLPDHVLMDLISYAMWLLECSHRSSRCHAAMFFGHALSFRVLLEMFDSKDGLRRMLNEISTLDILNFEQEQTLSDDNLFVSRQSARHVCVALKKYFEAHLALKADEIRRSHARTDGESRASGTPAYKAFKLPAEMTQDNLDLLLDYLPLRLQWKPVSSFINLGGVKLLLQLLDIGCSWNNYTGKAETLKSSLDVLSVCTTVPKTQMMLLEQVQLPEGIHTQGVSILLGITEWEISLDADIQKSALNCLINCACGPVERLGGGVGRFLGYGSKKRLNHRAGEEVLTMMWEGIRSNNGIMMLLKLLSVKTPITDADSIRTLACKALVGLSRSETVRQIMSKLPLFTTGHLQLLMKEPVLQDKRQEHVKFCKFGNELIERVSGKRQNAHMDASLDDIRRADIVAQTKIIYHEKELLQLIHDHLISKGFVDTALTLQKEASLPQRSSVCTTPHPTSPHIYNCPTTPRLVSSLFNISPHPTSPHIYNCPTTPRLGRQLSHPGGSGIGNNHGNNRNSPNIVPTTPTTPSGPIRINLANSRTNQSPVTSQQRVQFSAPKPSRFVREKEITLQSPLHRKFTHKSKGDYSMNLDKLVTEYLRNQHGLCRNPVTTCPTMSFFMPHRCPTPLHRICAPTNLTSRNFRKQIYPPCGGPDGVRCDRKFIYSRFRNIRSLRDTEDESCFSCCRFTVSNTHLLLGTYDGDVKVNSLLTGKEESTMHCHNGLICHCEQSKDTRLLLTSALWGQPMSALWTMGDNFENKLNFDDDNHVEFSKHIQDRIVGTKEETARVYDVNTGQCLLTLFDAKKANGYTKNAATFSPTDDIVLNDGVLWDSRSGEVIHKFDKFNPNISGSFHPHGMEVVINSEVWDLRTYHLLRTVPALDQCQINFNSTGDVIYGALYHIDDTDVQDERMRNCYGSTFRTFDATDYTNIATIDVKKNIMDLCTDKSDCYLAVIESQKDENLGSAEENVCRIYEVGKLKDEDDDEAEDEEEDVEEDAEDEDDDENSSSIEVISIGDSVDGDDEDDNDDDDDDDNNDQNAENDSEFTDDDDDVDLDDDMLFALSDML